MDLPDGLDEPARTELEKFQARYKVRARINFRKESLSSRNWGRRVHPTLSRRPWGTGRSRSRPEGGPCQNGITIVNSKQEPRNELSIRLQCTQEARHLIPSPFLFFKQSRYRRRNLVDGVWLAQEGVNAGAPGFLLAIVSWKHDDRSMATVREALRTEY